MEETPTTSGWYDHPDGVHEYQMFWTGERWTTTRRRPRRWKPLGVEQVRAWKVRTWLGFALLLGWYVLAGIILGRPDASKSQAGALIPTGVMVWTFYMVGLGKIRRHGNSRAVKTAWTISWVFLVPTALLLQMLSIDLSVGRFP